MLISKPNNTKDKKKSETAILILLVNFRQLEDLNSGNVWKET